MFNLFKSREKLNKNDWEVLDTVLENTAPWNKESEVIQDEVDLLKHAFRHKPALLKDIIIGISMFYNPKYSILKEDGKRHLFKNPIELSRAIIQAKFPDSMSGLLSSEDDYIANFLLRNVGYELHEDVVLDSIVVEDMLDAYFSGTRAAYDRAIANSKIDFTLSVELKEVCQQRYVENLSK